MGLMALLLLALVREDLVSGWQRTLPANAPNHFLINVQSDQVDAVRRFLDDAGVKSPVLFPMVRGRLVGINDRAVSPEDYEVPRAQRLTRREFNLTWAETLQENNTIIEGSWWHGKERSGAGLSVELGIASLLGIHIGDRLLFRVAGHEVSGRVTSIREVEWESLRPNFFVVAAPGLLEREPATYITSFHLPAERRGLLAGLVREFPSVTVLDVEALMVKVRTMLAHVSRAVEFVLSFCLLAGVLVLLAGVQDSREERRMEGALLRTLGAPGRILVRGYAAEFIALGSAAGLVAAVASTAVAWAVTTWVMNTDFQLNPWLWLAGVAGGALIVGVAGMLGVRSTLDTPPLQVMRES
jgi:putative ABC transport system permease protein